MRQIEFRGLRIDGKGWAYGDIVTAFDGLFICPADYDYKHYNEHWPEGFVEVNPSTVGQFTGLYDRNGVKIWEGDTIKVHGRGCDYWTGASIAYHCPSFKLQKDLKTCDEFGWDEWERDFEVTGNIHEPATGRE